MSTTQPITEQITGEQAHNILFTRLYAPTFFGKLAHEYGIVPASDEQAQAMLRMAGKLRNAHDVLASKQASAAQVDPLLRLEQQLDSHLNKLAGDSQAEVTEEQLFKTAAAELTKDQLLVQAALSYQNAYAETLQAQQTAA